jgi:hypothetical protein
VELSTDDTPGLLAMLSRALKSKDPILKSESEAVQESRSPSEPDADAHSSTTEPVDDSSAAVDVTGTPDLSAEAEVPPSVVESHPNESAVTPSRPPSSYKVSVDEARDIILRGLQRLPDFPAQGVEVKLYGSRPWGAMLVFAPGSTSHRNATFFRSELVDMVVSLRKQIDIDHGE